MNNSTYSSLVVVFVIELLSTNVSACTDMQQFQTTHLYERYANGVNYKVSPIISDTTKRVLYPVALENNFKLITKTYRQWPQQ